MIAFYLPGGVPVYLFSILLGLGAALGLLWVGLQSQSDQAVRVMNAGLVGLLGSLLVGRAAYVAVHWSYFQTQRVEIPQIFLGGLTWSGALAGGVLAVLIYAALIGLPAGSLLDALLPLLGMVVISAWLACWLDGCAYGQISQAWWALPARNEWGVITRRVPVQLLGALLTLAVVWLVESQRLRLPVPGQAALLAMIALSAQMFALSFLRADAAPSWQGLHLESWSALLLVVCFLLAFVSLTLREKLLRSRSESSKGSAAQTVNQDL